MTNSNSEYTDTFFKHHLESDVILNFIKTINVDCKNSPLVRLAVDIINREFFVIDNIHMLDECDFLSYIKKYKILYDAYIYSYLSKYLDPTYKNLFNEDVVTMSNATMVYNFYYEYIENPNIPKITAQECENMARMDFVKWTDTMIELPYDSDRDYTQCINIPSLLVDIFNYDFIHILQSKYPDFILPSSKDIRINFTKWVYSSIYNGRKTDFITMNSNCNC